MNAGLTNLSTLKRELLGDAMQSEVKWDSVLQTLGLGVAGLFERITNRRLGYLAGDTIAVSANREHYVLPRYPLGAVSSVETQYLGDTAWTAATGEPASINSASGLVRFWGALGGESDLIKITWDGGYWWEPMEPEDAGYPSSPAVGVTRLPDELRAAFLLQCEAIWAQRDKLGMALVDRPSVAPALAGLELLPMVREILRTHARYQLS